MEMELFGDLGETAFQVAASLSALGVKGVPVSSCECPVSRYLTEVKGFAVAEVYAGYAWVLPDSPGSWVYVPTSRGVREFVGEFDCGWYPELIQDARGEKTQ